MARTVFATQAAYATYTGTVEADAPSVAALGDASDTVSDAIRGYAYVVDPDTGLPTDTALAEVLEAATIEQARYDLENQESAGLKGVKSASILGVSYTFDDDTVTRQDADPLAPRALRVLTRAGVLPIRVWVV